jgi:esterase/lipase superfamily enzyme
MLFITNRIPKESIRTRAGRTFRFDLDNNAPSNSAFFCERHAEHDYTEIGSLDFLKRLKQHQAKQVLLYIHGFSNLPEPGVFGAAAELQALCDAQRQNEVVVVPLVWPCDNDLGVVKDYWDDQKSADMSAYAFARVLEKFNAWRNSDKYNPSHDPCLKRMNLLAHSMGNRVLRETLRVWDAYDLAQGVPLIFRNAFLVAADIVNESLHRGGYGEVICHSARNVIVYYASDDLALRASKAANLKNKVASRRLGHTGPEDMRKVPGNVYAIDCDDFNTRYDPPKGHSYFRYGPTPGKPGVVFKHIWGCLDSGRVFPDAPERREAILTDAS